MILNEILSEKRKEVREDKLKFPLEKFRHKLKFSNRDFKKAITKRLSLIAEIKRKSPSEGIICSEINAKKLALEYKNAGANALSVLTDKKFFGGSLEDLNEAKAAGLPLLRKDFIIDEYQIYESRLYGADAVLLIASFLSAKKIDRLIDVAGRLKMKCIVEVHTEKELGKALKTKAEIVGINNRDLDTLRIDLNTTLMLAGKIPKGKVIVSESGFKSREDIKIIRNKVNAVLIGTAFMKSENIKDKGSKV